MDKQIELVSIQELQSDQIRESMKNNLPEFLQPALTWLTSKPYEGQKSWESRGIDYLVTAILMLVLGLCIGLIAIKQGDLSNLFVPISWILVTGGVTQLRLTIMHSCSHKSLTTWRKLDDWIGEWITVVTMSLCFKEYRIQHTKVHHSEALMESGEPTYDFLINKLGLRFGCSKKELWKRLVSCLTSPSYHLIAFIERLKLTFFSSDHKHNLRSAIFWGIVLGLVSFYGIWIQFIIVWLIPVTIMYEISFALRHCVEHCWIEHNTFNSRRERLPYLTKAVFLGEQTPQKDAGAISWGKWWVRMICYHLIVRLTILTADSTCHDYHHRNPSSREWRNSIFVREDIARTDNSYKHSWGLLETIDDMFDLMSRRSSI